MGDAVAHRAPVLLELRLALAAEGAAAPLAGEMRPGPLEPRQEIFLAGQLHLELGLAGVGPLGEHLEDDLLAVDDGEGGFSLPVALLGGGERFVDDNDIGAGGPGLLDQFADLAPSKEKCGGGGPQVDEGAAFDGQSQVLDELAQFREKLGALAGGHARCLHPDQVRSKDAPILVEKLGHKGAWCEGISREARVNLTAGGVPSRPCRIWDPILIV